MELHGEVIFIRVFAFHESCLSQGVACAQSERPISLGHPDCYEMLQFNLSLSRKGGLKCKKSPINEKLEF